MAEPTPPRDEQTSYRLLFFACSAALVLVTAWTFWDEAQTRRPWKDYQRDFNRLEYALASEELKAARAEQAQPEMAAKLAGLEQELKAAEAKAAAASQAAAARLRQAQAELTGLAEKLTFAKADLEEAYYWVDYAVHHGKGADREKARAAEVEREVKRLQPLVDALQAKADRAQADQRAAGAEAAAIRAKLAEARKRVSDLERRLEAARARPQEIHQVVLEGLDRNEFDQPIFRVDRCRTCHMGIDRAGFETAPQPFRTHPHLPEIFGKHPIDRFGCSVCHQGQGPTLEVETAHGFVPHWDRPMLSGPPGARTPELVQAACRKCHADQREIPYAPDLAKGRALFETLGCHGCHNARGFERLDKVGPDLRRVKAKVDPAWLVRWIQNPRDYLPRTKMPFFDLNADEATSIAAYLFNKSEPLPGPIPGFGPGSPAKGKELLGKRGCLGCHRVGKEFAPVAPLPEGDRQEAQGKRQEGEGVGATAGEKRAVLPAPAKADGAPAGPSLPWPAAWDEALARFDFAPDLGRIGSKVNAAWLYQWLKDPARISPKTLMPNLRLSDEDARHVTAYLMSLGRKTEAGPPAAELAKPDRIAQGERLIRKRGCFGCHDIKGFETADKIAPELSTYGTKRLLELFFGDALAPGSAKKFTDPVPMAETWESYTFWKVKQPQAYATERVEQIMPNFGLTDEEAKALRVLLKSFQASTVAAGYRRSLVNHEAELEEGRRLVRRFNCQGCHVLEGRGGGIRAFFENPALAPPPLVAGHLQEGEKVQSTWLYQWLARPTGLRPWLEVRMPTFALTIDDATSLTRYFAVLANLRLPYEFIPVWDFQDKLIQAGQRLATKEYFDCFSCHMQGTKTPEGPPEGWAPDLGLAWQRLRPDWIAKWLKDPQKIQPGTKMPAFFSDKDSVPPDILNGDLELQILALRDYLMTAGRR
jgi:cytochrome c2